MSIKRQLQFRYRGFVNYLRSLSLPAWVDGPAIRVMIVGAIVVMGAAYILKTTSSATGGYELDKLETQVSSLQAEIQKIQIQIADNSSINSIQSRLATMNMVDAGSIKYMDLSAKDVAVANK